MVAGEINPQYNDPNSHSGRYPPDWEARRQYVYERDDWTCRACGTPSGPYGGPDSPVLHAHHQTPLSHGGSNHLENLVTLCERCHNEAHDHDVSTGGSQRRRQGQSSGHSPVARAIMGAILGPICLVLTVPLLVFGVWGFGPVGSTLLVLGFSFVGMLFATRWIATTIWAGWWVMFFVGPAISLHPLSFWELLPPHPLGNLFFLAIAGPLLGLFWAAFGDNVDFSVDDDSIFS
jgi:hypothetical protein